MYRIRLALAKPRSLQELKARDNLTMRCGYKSHYAGLVLLGLHTSDHDR